MRKFASDRRCQLRASQSKICSLSPSQLRVLKLALRIVLSRAVTLRSLSRVFKRFITRTVDRVLSLSRVRTVFLEAVSAVRRFRY